MDAIIFYGVFFIFIFTIIILGMISEKKENNMMYYLDNKHKERIIKLDEFTTNFYINELSTIIRYKCVYNIDSKIGKLFNDNKSIINDIPNEEIHQIYTSTVADINDLISPEMRIYLSKLLGEKWLDEYIHMETMSYILNYSDLTVRDLTNKKFS